MNNIIVMGVTGSGKSTIGMALADRLKIPFFDGDDFHPAANIEKMKNGIPLNDEDRLPWLLKLKDLLEQKKSCVLACSALKAAYRNVIAGPDDHVVYLKIDPETVRKRLSERKGHFMPAQLVNSQFEALEEPANALEVSASLPKDEVVEIILSKLDIPKQ